MTRHHNGPTGQRLMRLWQLLQQRDTPVVLIVEIASSCGIDPRQLLAEKFCGSVRA
jgi:glutathione peroxidase-family protein